MRLGHLNDLGSTEKKERWFDEYPNGDLSDIFRHFPTVQNFSLSWAGNISLGGNESFPSLRTLILKGVSFPALALQLSRFPGLHALRAYAREFIVEDTTQEIYLPELNSLKINDVSRFLAETSWTSTQDTIN